MISEWFWKRFLGLSMVRDMMLCGRFITCYHKASFLLSDKHVLFADDFT